MLVKVAIDLALDRLWTYSVPEEMEKKLAVGQLLLVPFGRRTARGFAMETMESGDSAGFDVKSVISIVDPVPFFKPAMIELVRKIAAYTATPVEKVLQTAVPAAVLKPGSRAKEALYVEYAGVGEGNVAERGRWIAAQVERLGGGWMPGLCRELKTTPATLRSLAAKGWLSIEKRAKRRAPVSAMRILPTKPLPPNDGQRAALASIASLGAGGSPGVLLLHGVTGSGKTEVYLQAIAAELEAGRGAIVLVPEISLTPQTVQRFVSRFGDRVALLHSALSDGERYDEWHRLRSGAARVAVGPRSAVFAPVADLGLIVVDEEHEPSYKQDSSAPRYHARDVAVLRGAIEGAKVVLGSATPSLESWHNAETGKYAFAVLPSRAGRGTFPKVATIDMGSPENRSRIFSRELLDAISSRLDRSEQTILLLNRRGYSRSVECCGCGATVDCPGCGIPYTYHKSDSCCRCHVCGGWIPVPASCPACGSTDFTYRGIGTQRAESVLKTCFPRARIARMDADSTSRKNSHDDILGAFRRHETDILLGTQMIAKGLDFPNVTLVGVLNADMALKMPDFRAAERAFQLLSQVTGRAGRADLPGEALIQTYDPGSETIKAAAAGDFASFAGKELKMREEAFFPPYCKLCVVNMRSRDPGAAAAWAAMYAASLAKVEGLVAGDAVPAAQEMADGWHRWQIVLKSKTASIAVRAWKWLVSARPPPPEVKAVFDVDAVNLR